MEGKKNSKYLQKKAEKRSITSRSKNKYKDKKVLIPASELEQLKIAINSIRAEVKKSKLFLHKKIKNHKITATLTLSIITALFIALGTAQVHKSIFYEFIYKIYIPWSSFALMLMLTAFLYEQTDHDHPEITEKVNKIGGFRIPFDRKWRDQWKLGRICSTYRVGIIFETLSTSLLIVLIIWLIVEVILKID